MKQPVCVVETGLNDRLEVGFNWNMTGFNDHQGIPCRLHSVMCISMMDHWFYLSFRKKQPFQWTMSDWKK